MSGAVSPTRHANATVTLRRATAADAAMLADLGERTFREAFARDNNPDDLAAYIGATYSVADQEHELADPAVMTIVADRGGESIGYLMLRRGASPACVTGHPAIEIARLYVVQSAWGDGTGATLMGEGLSVARAAGAESVWLGVWEHNVRARRFYERWGFRCVGTQPFVLGSDVQTDHVLSLRLTADD
ncbi:MAG: GNAT family N-acetyltransferase [Gemmatimonadaceae bacterium]